jgi:hypothetical protein
MKKFVLSFFSLLLVLSLALSSFSSVTAAGGGDPWVTPVSGDMEFSATIVPIASLPGVIELASQMLAPAGFPAGEAQFGGNGVRLTEFETGKATACFSLSAIEVRQGWGGKVGMWDGAKWVLLPTTIAPVAEEASTTSACAGITGNGTYAFIKYISDAALLPKGPPACGVLTFAFPFDFDFEEFDGWMEEGIIVHNSLIPEGTPISYQLVNVVPSGFFTSGQSGSGFVVDSFDIGLGQYVAFVEFDPAVIFEYDYFDNLESFTLRVFLPQCYTDFQFPDDLFNLER